MNRWLSRPIGAAGTVLAVLAICGSAIAFFSAGGSGTAVAAVTTLSAPTISAATPASGGTVALTWKAVTPPGGGTVTYYVTRNGVEADGSCPGAEEPQSVTSCTDSGLAPGSYEYKVTALFNSWSKTSAVVTAKVTVGPVSKFTITGSTASPSTGAGVNLTITAKDAAGSTVTTFTGSHSLTFSGASNSPEGKAATVVAAAGGTAVPFGTATALTFSSGVATASSSKNGYLRIYRSGEANVTATEGSLTTPVPLTLNVLPTATRFTLTAASATAGAGVADNLTISASDAYGNASTNYTGSHDLTFSGTGAGSETSPSGKAPTVDNSSGTAIAFGTATAINFSAGVATVSDAANGEMILYKSGSAAIKATEGSVTTPTALAVTVAPAAAAGLTLTSSVTSLAAGGASNLTATAKDAYGNTAVSYTGSKNLTYSGAATSPSGSVPSVVSSAGTVTPFGTATAITFTNGVAAAASSKNGYLRLYKAETLNLVATDGTFTTPAVAITVAPTTATKVALVSPAASPGTIGSPCLFTCTVSGTGNSGTISAALAITDAYGNTVSNIGAGKTATVTSSPTDSTGGTISGGSLTFPETGAAVTPTRFTFTAAASNTVTNTITAASTGYTSATVTAAR